MAQLVWLRRNLRLDDNLPLFKALQSSEKVQLVFILDTDILSRFPNTCNRRVQFIKNALCQINDKLQEFGGGLLVLEGCAAELIPKIAKEMGATKIFADEDYEPAHIKRDNEVRKALEGIAELELYCDHLIFHPKDIVKSDGGIYKVYTPYMKVFRAQVSRNRYLKYESLKMCAGKIASFESRYHHNIVHDDLWGVVAAHEICDRFVAHKMQEYKEKRDYLADNGTSRISPYLRFGLISIRELFRKAYDANNSFAWINELIWREFYTAILYHFPHTANSEFNSKYASIPWSRDVDLLHRITNAETGYPIIDAAITQLLTEGWMHNRARMIVASFWTKNLFLDWRLGEEFFAQHLMDYELSSNVGGWQWAASCGTDAQPYFRVFNSMLQAQKFDPDGEYVKRYIGDREAFEQIVDYSVTRAKAIAIFKNT